MATGTVKTEPVIWSTLGRRFWVFKEDWSDAPNLTGTGEDTAQRCYILYVYPLEVKNGFATPPEPMTSQGSYTYPGIVKECRHNGRSTFEFRR